MKMMDIFRFPKRGRLLRSLPLLIALSATFPLAHEIARDGNVGGLIHIEPDDAPLAGKPNRASFEVNQRGGRAILLSQCACRLSVYAGGMRPGARPASTPKLSQGKSELTAVLNFPAAGAYTLVLQGRPRAGADFPSFTLKWTVRADITAGGGGHPH